MNYRSNESKKLTNKNECISILAIKIFSSIKEVLSANYVTACYCNPEIEMKNVNLPYDCSLKSAVFGIVSFKDCMMENVMSNPL